MDIFMIDVVGGTHITALAMVHKKPLKIRHHA